MEQLDLFSREVPPEDSGRIETGYVNCFNPPCGQWNGSEFVFTGLIQLHKEWLENIHKMLASE